MEMSKTADEKTEDEPCLSLTNLKTLTQCSICRESYSDPRVLPCIHTFCLDCLQQSGLDKRPGDVMPCPLCRKEFTIPEDGFDGLQKDFRLKGLLDMCKDRCLSSAPESEEDVNGSQEIYCFDCDLAIGVMSYFERHLSHHCSNIRKAVEGFRDLLFSHEENASAWEAHVVRQITDTETETLHLDNEGKRLERLIRNRGEDLKRLVETHVEVMMDELSGRNLRRLSQMQEERNILDQYLLTVQGFKARSRRIRTMEEKVSPGDVCRAAVDLDEEAETIRQQQEHLRRRFRRKPHSSNTLFEATPLEKLITKNTNNIVGKIEGQSPSSGLLLVANSITTATAATLRSLRLTDSRVLLSVAIGVAVMLLGCVMVNSFMGAAVGLLTASMIFAVFYFFVPNTRCLRLMMSIKTHDSSACGVTYLRNNIYVIVSRHTSLPPSSSIIVYRNQAPFYRRLEDIPTPQISMPWDVASCHRTSTLYVTDSGNRCVWKVSPDDHLVVSWLTDTDTPHTVSVSSDGQVLLLRDALPFSYLEVYAPDAVTVECIRLPSKITRPHHAVETSRGTFLISHGTWINQTHGIYELDRHGLILREHNSTECFWGILKSISLLLDKSNKCDDARHLAVDIDDRVFVADWFNDRIVRFNRNLRWNQMFLTSPGWNPSWPMWRLCYIKERQQLLIVHESRKGNRVHVYELP